MENDQFAQLSSEFLRSYYEERGIENLECEELAVVRMRAEAVKESYKVARNIMISDIRAGSSRIYNNRKAAAAAKVRDEVYKKELAGDIRMFHEKCRRLEQQMIEKKEEIDKIRSKNDEMRFKLDELQQRNEQMKMKDYADLIAENLGVTYEERRRSGFVYPLLFGDATDVVRYGGVLPNSSQD